MSTVLFIHSYQRAADLVHRHAPYLKLSGCRLVGVNTVGGEHKWPSGFEVISLGDEDGYSPPARGAGWKKESWVCLRFLDTMDWFLSSCSESHMMITEPDSIFLMRPPEPQNLDCFATPAGDCPPEWKTKASRFYHPPWWMSREFAARFLVAGESVLFNEMENGGGAVDVFFGAVVEKLGVRPAHYGTWSCNGGDLKWPGVRQRARQAFLGGAWFMHGIKTQEELDFITSR